jgi:Kef-type K+ transport system membrane component KefB/nucleotide-binding universal stress UspA family protein
VNHNYLNIADHIELPVNDPVLVFAIILFIILISPVILKKFRVPGILGLIVSGIIIGPNGLNIISDNQSIDLFATIGILFLMFIAGLDLDQQQFSRTRNKSLLFGLLTYIVPFAIGLPVCYYLLEFNFITSLMISNMFATHTMVSYPIVTRLGLSRNEAVAVATGGTVITDTLVLFVLAVITGAATGGNGLQLYVTLLLSFILFLLFMAYIVPPVSRWVFKRLEDDNYSQFIFVALVVFICAVLARVAGLEPIIGAFAAGFILNSMIPAQSILRNRIDFTGNALFIPFFLISVGMVVDLKVVLAGPVPLIIAATLTTVALAGKLAAAEITSRLLRFSKDQRHLLFGLTSSHAAAILAVIMVGYRIGIIDDNVMNGTIILILVTCFVSSLVTEAAGRKIALSGKQDSFTDSMADHETIIVSLSNPQNMERLIDLALTLKKKNHNNPMYGLCVVNDDADAAKKLSMARSTLEQAGSRALASGRKIETIATIDNNIASGIKRVAREKGATDIIIGTSGKLNLADILFGRPLEQLAANSSQTIFIYNAVYPINLYKNVVLFLPPNAEKEAKFRSITDKVLRIAESNSIPLNSYSYGNTYMAIDQLIKKTKSLVHHNFVMITPGREIHDIKLLAGDDDLLVVFSPQRGSISWDQAFDAFMKKALRTTAEGSYLIINPGLVS